ncbi:MAG: hypothetical protein ACRDFZ_04650 [Candidatus Limnocylindria bacterium]
MRAVRAAIAAGVIGIGLLAGWIWPPLAAVTVWPFLLIVPGWALVAWGSRGRARISATGRLGLAVVLSVAVSAHLSWWLATLLGGNGREVVFAAAAILAVPVPLAAWTATTDPRTWPAAATSRVRRVAATHPGGLLLGLGTTVWVGAVLASGIWQVYPGGVSVGGSNWSDLGVHLSIAQSVNAGNFPPQVPFFAGEPLVYHWFADFHAALLAAAAGLFAVPAFVIQSALLAGSLALVVHGLALALVRDWSARRAAFLAVLLVVLGGGLGWMRLLGDLANGQGAPWDLMMTNTYDNQWLTDWPYFSIPSVMTTGLLVHRATTAGLPLLVGAVLLIVAGLPTIRRRRIGSSDHPRLIVLSGLSGALLAPFHFFFFPLLPLLVLIWVLVGGRLFDRSAPRHALLFAAPYVAALPFAAAAFSQATGSGWLRLVAGWPTAPVTDGPGAVLFFYLTNLGIPFALAVLALALRQAPARAFLALWVAILFLIPNVVQVSFVSFDMNKYFQAMWIAVGLLTGWLLARTGGLALAAVLVLSLASPVLASVHTAFSQNFLMSTDQLAAAAWIAAETPEGSVFVTDDWIIAPTDPGGRLRLTSYGPYIANLGYDPALRQAAVHAIRCGGDAAASAALMRQYGAGYVLPTGGGGCEAPVDFAGSELFDEAYANQTVRIFRLSSAP